MNQPRVRRWWPLAVLGALAIASLYLAANRIYQVDEAQNLFSARILGSGASAEFFNHAPLFLLGPIAHLAGRATVSADLFFWGRMIFLGVFWLNTFLLALNLRSEKSSHGWAVALLAAGTLAPLWDHGFEIRHDNLLLTGLLFAWWVVRKEGLHGALAMFLVGLTGALLQFCAFKSFLYFLPLGVALACFPPPHWRGSRPLQALGLVGGVLFGALLAWGAYRITGTWDVFLNGFRGGIAVSKEAAAFKPWPILMRMLQETPLLAGLAAGAMAAWGLQFRRHGREACSWSGGLPELVLAAGALGVLVINPTPFPYNLVLVVPFLLLTLRTWWATGQAALEAPQATMPWLAALLMVVHGVPFLAHTTRHFDWDNGRQERLMKLAESLTDPHQDRVYDAVGLVPTRKSIGYHWYLHSLNVREFEAGRIPPVREMLTCNPASVLIPNYRMAWLPQADKDFIATRYVQLADDFWVLGANLPPGGAEWTCQHPGRYVVLLPQGTPSTSPIKVDGVAAGEAPRRMEAGIHRVEAPPGVRPLVMWVGPRLEAPPRLEAGDHQRLFVNWY